MKPGATLLALVCLAAPVLAQEQPAPQPQPQAEPAPGEEDTFGEAQDPFAEEGPPSPPEGGFDPNAVDLTPAPGFELHGRANLAYSYTDGKDSVEDLRHSGLQLSSLDLYAQWFPSAYVGLVGEAELSNELQNETHDVSLEPELAALEVRPLGDERLRLRLGQFPVPFGIERRYYAPPRNELVDRPAVFRRLYPGSYSDLGVMGWGQLRLGPWGGQLELELGMTKGLTGNRRKDRPELWERDENREPMFSGRLGWTLVELDPSEKGGPTAAPGLPFPIRLTVGASFLSGHYDELRRRRFLFQGYDLELRLGGLRLRGELVFAEFELPFREGDPQHGYGLYGQVAYHYTFGLKGLQEAFVAFRYDRLDRNQQVSGEDLDLERYHFGLGWLPMRELTVKLGYELVTGRGAPPDNVYFEIGYAF